MSDTQVDEGVGKIVEDMLRKQIECVHYLRGTEPSHNFQGGRLSMFLREYRTVGISFPRRTNRTTRAIKVVNEFKHFLYVAPLQKQADRIMRDSPGVMRGEFVGKAGLIRLAQTTTPRKGEALKYFAFVLDEVVDLRDEADLLYSAIAELSTGPDAIVIRIH